jgi:hypothetical protein
MVIAAIVGCGTAFVEFAVNAGRILVVDDPKPSDVIVSLAGETDRRPQRAVELLQRGYGRAAVIDVPAGVNIFGFSEEHLAQSYIRDLPGPSSVRVCSIVGLSTRDESHDFAKCLGADGAHSVLIVTSDFHTRRALSIFRHEFPRQNFSVAAVPDASEFGTRWWTHRQWAKTCFYEWIRLLWWEVVDRWR